MVNLLDLNKVTSQNIFVSDYLNTDLDSVQAIAPVFSETSKFFTPLQCDLEHIFQQIVVSSNLPPDLSADLASRKIVVSSDLTPDLDPVQAIATVFRETSKFFTPLQCDLEPEINKPNHRRTVVYWHGPDVGVPVWDNLINQKFA